MTTEREKMLAGELYDPLDPELAAARVKARDLCQTLNATRDAEQDERRRLLIDLFGAGISVEAFERLAQGQAACLQSGDCWDGVAAPPKRAAAPAEATPLPGAPANVA